MVLSTAATFVNVVAPSGLGMGGMAVMVSEARRRGYSSAGVIVAGVGLTRFSITPASCACWLWDCWCSSSSNDLEAAQLAASVFLLVVAAGLALLIYLECVHPSGSAASWCGLARQANRLTKPLLRREVIPEERARVFAAEVGSGLQLLRRHPKGLLIPTVLSLCSKGLLVVVMLMMFLSFNVPFSFGTLIAGSSIGYLFMLVSPTPSGIGVVEGALPLALGSMHIPFSAATVVALSYWGDYFLGAPAGRDACIPLVSQRKKIEPVVNSHV